MCAAALAPATLLTGAEFVKMFGHKDVPQDRPGFEWHFNVCPDVSNAAWWECYAVLYCSDPEAVTARSVLETFQVAKWTLEYFDTPSLWRQTTFVEEPDRVDPELLPALAGEWKLRPFQERAFLALWHRHSRVQHYRDVVSAMAPLDKFLIKGTLFVRARGDPRLAPDKSGGFLRFGSATLQMCVGAGKTVVACANIAKLLQTYGAHAPVISACGMRRNMPDLFGATYPFDDVPEEHYRARWFERSAHRLKDRAASFAVRESHFRDDAFVRDGITGKSATCLAGGVLVLVPTSLLSMWCEKLEAIVPPVREGEDKVRVFCYYGAARNAKLREMVDADVVLCPYSLAGKAKSAADMLDRDLFHTSDPRRSSMDSYQRSTGMVAYSTAGGTQLRTTSGRVTRPLEGTEMAGVTTPIWSTIAAPVMGALRDPVSHLGKIHWRMVIADEAHKTLKAEMFNMISTDALVRMSATFTAQPVGIMDGPSSDNGYQFFARAAEFRVKDLLQVPVPTTTVEVVEPTPGDIARYNAVYTRLEKIRAEKCAGEYNQGLHRMVRRLWDTTSVHHWPTVPAVPDDMLVDLHKRTGPLADVTLDDEIRARMEMCPICMDDYADPVLEPSCGNVFCCACLSQWILSRRRSCPLCRASVDMSKIRRIRVEEEKEEEEEATVEEVEDTDVLQSPLHGEHRSGKVLKLLEILQADTGDKTMVVVHTHAAARALCKMLAEELGTSVCYLSTSMSATARGKALSNFCTADCDVLVISARCAGVGLNIVEATQVVFMESYMLSTLVHQVVGRAVRQGQTRSVKVRHLVTRGTADAALVRDPDVMTHVASAGDVYACLAPLGL